MLGFLYAVKGEMETSETALQLLQHGSPWQYALMALWIYASLVPITKGARHEAFGELRQLRRQQQQEGRQGQRQRRKQQQMCTRRGSIGRGGRRPAAEILVGDGIAAGWLQAVV
jgi:hypothetical protein